ncbi:1,4-dihydroxy-2-naphthoyl-CoA synthase [Paraburkholderia graminis C4D1M]|jgi:enoyl-CoA hydratase/carnithine racemase|uniref:Enoyl-CoA hydratase/isomerase n=1 Tax=Paraburkholderia graminis (strain ATCC 700544 / DSM 17151 / LMG 18924 / NCIMB 13744 / C4D1M) TaxID=396598 RepID=B1G5X3_PARG4|nr:enoyl-CoA hydratase/isomerase family protein [Paraburkholderia graminis]EDT08442.1 Enoyl-CoA hydratase/isomerase [Paraburkholderia graminis C4D1M]CAB3714873.1 1,4-dihydroxy-2-naphthoyl-CoA synthase [Paraburkholderia graminis C4D1M]
MQIEDIGGVRQLVLDRPQRRNALSQALMEQLEQELRRAESDASVAAIVLSGAPPAFCAGSDLKELGGLSIDHMCEHELETARIARGIAGLSKPVIAAVEGFALGGGFILAVSCDLVVSAVNARWHLPEVPNGWLPPWGLQALIARVGAVRARMLVWGDEPIDGVEAHRLGVADHLAEAGHVDARAIALAQRLARLPRGAVASAKRFFEPFIALDGERLDREATRIFADDCKSDAAQQIFAKFAVKS